MASSPTRNKSDGSTQNATFQWISADSAEPYITIDNQQRLYLSAGARKTIGVDTRSRIIVGYDKANKRVVIAKPEVVRVPNIRPFLLDKKAYCSARAIVQAIDFDYEDLPLRFAYVGRDFSEYDVGSYAFQRVES